MPAPKRPRSSVVTPAVPSPSPRTILLATTGLTPAILTETVWALAHEKHPVIPDAVIVLTTKTGAEKIAHQLFGSDEVWRQLRTSILGKNAATDPRLDFDTTPDRVKIVHHRAGSRRLPLDELANPAQNTAFADAITQELWTHTSQPDTRVIASLAGGFKTMSALMLSAMQLLANPRDRVTHVLVSGGYENTTPPFFFPEQKQQKLKTRDGPPVLAAAAASRIQLIDVPLIPLRRWFADALDRKPPSYETLVTGSIEALEAHAGDLTLELGPVAIPQSESKHWIRLNGAEHRFSPDRYVYLRFFAERLHAGEPPCPKLADTIEDLETWLADHKDTEPRLHRMWEAFSVPNAKGEVFDADDLPKRLKDFRVFLEKLPGGRALAAALPAKGHWGLKIPRERITLH